MLAAPVANAQKITTGVTGATQPSLRNGLRLIACSPRCPGFDSHRRLADRPQDLIPASGDQDHTISLVRVESASSLRIDASIASRIQHS